MTWYPLTPIPSGLVSSGGVTDGGKLLQLDSDTLIYAPWDGFSLFAWNRPSDGWSLLVDFESDPSNHGNGPWFAYGGDLYQIAFSGPHAGHCCRLDMTGTPTLIEVGPAAPVGAITGTSYPWGGEIIGSVLWSLDISVKWIGFDLSSNTWTVGSTLGVQMYDSATATDGTSLFLVEGWNDTAAADSSDIQAWDPGTDTWSVLTTEPSVGPREDPSAVVAGGKLYVLGGIVGPSYDVIDDVTSYDLGATTWATETSLPSGRAAAAVLAVGTDIYSVGGYDNVGDIDDFTATTPSLAIHLIGAGTRTRGGSNSFTVATLSLHTQFFGSFRIRAGSGTLQVGFSGENIVGLGYEVNSRTREGLGLLTVSVDPDLDAPTLPTYTPSFTAPVTIDGQPYLNNVKTPWIPFAEDHDIWGRIHLVIDGTKVTWFRRDDKNNRVWTHVLKWTDKSPGGDDLLDLWFPAITARDDLGEGDLSWLRPQRDVEMRHLHPDDSTITTIWEGVVDAIEDSLADQPGTGDPASQLIVHCLGIWADLDRFITLPRPSIDQYLSPIPDGHLTPVDPGQLLYAHIHRARLYGWSGRMHRPDDTGLTPSGEQGAYGVPLGSQTCQDILATMQTGSDVYTVVNDRPRGIKLDTLAWDGVSFDFSFHCMQPGVTHSLTHDPREAYNAIYGHGQAPFGPVDFSIGRPDAVADWSNWQYPVAALDPPDYPLDPGNYFHAGDGQHGFQPFSDELRAHGYDLDSQDTYLASDFDLIETFQDNSGALVDGIVGFQTWAQAFEVAVNSKALAQSYIKELVTSNTRMPFLLNARGGILDANPLYDPREHPRREVLEEFGSLRKSQAVKSAKKEFDRIHAPIYRGTITATNVDPPEMHAFHTRAGMSMLFKGHAGEDRVLFVAQVERVPGTQVGSSRTVTWTVSEQPEGLATLAQRLQRRRGVKDLIASNRPPRHHAKQIESFPIFDAEAGAGIFLPGQGQTHGLWNRYLIPMGGQCDVNAVKIVADRPAKLAAAMFANPRMTIDQLAAIIPDPSAGTDDPWAKHATALENLGICWALGNPTAMGGYWPNDAGTGTLTGVLADLSSWQFRANSTYGALFVWADRDCFVSGDPTAKHRAIFPNPVGQ